MKAFTGPRRQGGWVIGALAAASAIMQGASSLKGGKASRDAAKAQREGLRLEGVEEARTGAKVYQATLGTQQARYAASGVDIGVGSVSQVLQETRDEYAKTAAANAYLRQQKLKGAQAEAKTAKYQAVGGFFSAAAQFGVGAADAYRNKSNFWGSG